MDWSYSKKKLPSWCHLRTDKRSERSRKNTAPRWFEKQKILGAKGGSWRLKKMETTVYHTNIRKNVIYKFMDMLISIIINNTNICFQSLAWLSSVGVDSWSLNYSLHEKISFYNYKSIIKYTYQTHIQISPPLNTVKSTSNAFSLCCVMFQHKKYYL